MEKTRFKLWHIPFLLVLIVGTFWIAKSRKQPTEAPFQHNEGVIFGTVYHTTYQYEEDINAEILKVLNAVDASLSMFNPNSTIAQINSGQTDETDSLIRVVFTLAQSISKETDGAFDVTVAPLVNAWGFGFKSNNLPNDQQVDSLRQLIGWQKINLVGTKIQKENPQMVMDFSAIAKGFGSDCVANLFKQKGIKNFMIEIGGEVVTSGTNPKMTPWHIGINRPDDDSTSTNNALQQILAMSDCAMATSGNYRNFYISNGKKIAHTIDPMTGYPVQHSILSSTVLAPTCAMADAYATSFMVMGLDKARALLNSHPEIQAYFIYADENNNNQIWYSPSLKANFTE